MPKYFAEAMVSFTKLTALLVYAQWILLYCDPANGSGLFFGTNGDDGIEEGLFAPVTTRSMDLSFGSKGLCVVGCTPYVDLHNRKNGIAKYRRLVDEMARNCDVLVHVGDTKPGPMPCNEDTVTESVHILRRAAKREGKLALYAPGDNEINDCHRLGSKEDPVAADFYKAEDVRKFIITDLKLDRYRDLTMSWRVDTHDMTKELIPGTNKRFSCEFDKYIELNNYAVATLEVIGSHYYLDDERSNKPPRNYPYQNEVDPLESRLDLFLNANGCTLKWIEESAVKAKKSGKRAMFFMLHATFYTDDGMRWLGNNGIGQFYATENLSRLTNGTISYPYKPIFDKLTRTALAYPELMFYVVHSDGHRFSTLRMNPTIDNRGRDKIYSHHNLMIHQVDGASRALTTYSKFTVDSDAFQPVTLKQEWSREAFETSPYGHSWISY